MTVYSKMAIGLAAASSLGVLAAAPAQARPEPTQIYVCPRNAAYEQWYFDPPQGPSYSYYFQVSMSLGESLDSQQTRTVTEITASEFFQRCWFRMAQPFNPNEIRGLVVRPSADLRVRILRDPPVSRPDPVRDRPRTRPR